MNTYMDDLWAIYNTKIVPFENTDDEFAHKAKDLYWSYTGLGDWIGDFFSALGEGFKNIIIGVLDALVDLVKGLAQLVVGVLKYVGSGAVVIVSSPFGATPAWAKDYFDGANDLLGGILNDPMILVEGIAQGASDAIDTKGVCYSIGYVGGSILGVKGLDKVGKFAKGVLSGTKADIVVNSLDDIAKHGLKSIDEIVNTAKITSLLELKRIGISSVDDLVGLGVTTAKDLPKLGIHTMKDLAELGIKSADDLAKLGIKNVDDFVEAGLGSLDDANRVFKEASGANSILNKGKEIFKKFNIDDAYVKPKHLSTSGGNGAKFLGSSKAAAEVILKDAMSKGKITSILDDDVSALGNSKFEITIDAGKAIGTKGETFIKVILSEDGGMLSAYPVK